MINEGEPDPAATAIAERAGVSVRTIYQHFADLESLYAGLVETQAVRVQPLLAAPEASGDLDQRIDSVVAQRRRLHETTAPVRRAISGRAATSPSIRRRLEDLAAVLRSQLREQFRNELDEADDPALLEALDALCSFETWERLRRTQTLDADQAAAALAVALRRLLR